MCPGCAGPYPGPARSGIILQREEDVIAEKRYYLNADRSRVVEEDDTDATYLLAAAGDDISNEDVERYGLGKKRPAEPEPMVVHSIAADPEPEPKPARSRAATDDDDAADAKAVSGPPANKARSGKADEDK